MSESNFIQKVGAACNKKEDLYQKSKTRYAVRSIFAGGFLICLGACLPPILKCGINHLKYDVFDGGNLSKENSLEESVGDSSLLYLL